MNVEVRDSIIFVTAQVDRLKAENCQEKAHVEAIIGAGIRHLFQSTAIVIF